MKILLISDYLPHRQESMLRYTEMLRDGLTEMGHQVTVVHPPVVFGRLMPRHAGLAKWISYIDMFLVAPFYLRTFLLNTDVVHICDQINSVYLPLVRSMPHLITCHDVIHVWSALGKFSQVKVSFTGRLYQKWIAASLRQAAHIVCVSQKTESDVRALFPELESQVQVIYNPLNWPYSPADQYEVNRVKDSLGLGSHAEYLFHIGGNQWYKNRVGVIRIFAALKKHPRFRHLKLVMAGKPWSPDLVECVETQCMVGDVIDAGNVSNSDLRALYTGALALLFPSLEEGFGWPILEAQACGCPVITTNRPPMTEVSGDAAIRIDPEHIEESAQQIAQRYGEFSELRQKGLQNAANFSARKTILAYEQLYKKVANGSL